MVNISLQVKAVYDIYLYKILITWINFFIFCLQRFSFTLEPTVPVIFVVNFIGTL